MKLKVAQEQKYVGDDWWEWAVWIDGDKEDLDQVKEVAYKLHHTFRDPLRTNSDRATKFRLESEGWGVFPIQVMVELKDGKEIKLQHDLKLYYPDDTPNAD